MQKAEWILAAMDRLTTCLHSALDAANEAAKALLTLLLESLETDRTSHQQTTSNGFRSLVTIKELAELWDVDERSIRQWKAKKGLPYRYVGADLRFDLIEVDEWTKRHRKNARNTTAANGKVSPLQRDCKRSRELTQCQSTCTMKTKTSSKVAKAKELGNMFSR